MKKNLYNKVIAILNKHESARNDDRQLYVYYLIYSCPTDFKENYIPLDVILKSPNMDTLGRIRRRIQNEEKLYLPTPKTKKIREKREKEYQSWTK